MNLVAIVDAILVFTATEFIALATYRRLSGRGLRIRQFAANLLAGASLMLAVRGALAGAGWPWLAACFAIAGLAHAVDLWLRRHDQR